MRKEMKQLAFLLLILYSFLTTIYYCHERVLNYIDTITMPINQEMCNKELLVIGEHTLNASNLSMSSIQTRLLSERLRHGARRDKSGRRPQRVAIIVPYRDRARNLQLFLYYMHQFLASQDIYYGIYLVEPLAGLRFNRAMLLNIGFVEASKEDSKWECFVFHDVDLLPESVDNVYKCDTKRPKQMAIAVSKFNYLTNSYFKERYFGGVNAFTKEQYLKINGLSNLYFDWGLEDDSARLRVLNEYSGMARLSPEQGRYFANCHVEQPKNPKRFLLYIGSQMDKTGLSTLKYDLVAKEKNTLFTRFYVNYQDSNLNNSYI